MVGESSSKLVRSVIKYHRVPTQNLNKNVRPEFPIFLIQSQHGGEITYWFTHPWKVHDLIYIAAMKKLGTLKAVSADPVSPPW